MVEFRFDHRSERRNSWIPHQLDISMGCPSEFFENFFQRIFFPIVYDFLVVLSV
jgi:hypothetical protein